MDVADWLQTLPTPDGARFLRITGGKDDEEGGKAKHLTTDEFVAKFEASPRGQQIIEHLKSPMQGDEVQHFIRSIGSDKFKNSCWGSFRLLARRELLLWWRDKYQIKAKIIQSKYERYMGLW